MVEKSKLTSRTDEAPLDAGGASSSASSAWAPESLDQMKSKSFQAAKLGFVAGAVIALKAKQLQLFTITSLTDAEAKVKDEGGNEVNIAMGDFLDQYRLHKGKVTDVLPGWSPGDHSFWCHTSEAWGIDVVKGCIGYALRATYAKHLQSLKLIQLLINPTSVKLVAPAKAGKVNLVAVSQRIDKKQGACSIALGNFEVTPLKSAMFYLQPHFVAPLAKDGTQNKAPFAAAFWCVRKCDEPTDANLILSWVAVAVGSMVINVPMLTNKVDLRADAELQWCCGADEPPVDAGKGAKKRRT